MDIFFIIFSNTETGDNAEYFYIQKASESELIYPLNIVKGRYHEHDLPPEIDDNKWLFKVIPYLTF